MLFQIPVDPAPKARWTWIFAAAEPRSTNFVKPTFSPTSNLTPVCGLFSPRLIYLTIRGDGRGRTFSLNLDANVFQCFDARCGAKGDVIDLWAALHHQNLREAALDLVHTFGLEPVPPRGTEKRNG